MGLPRGYVPMSYSSLPEGRTFGPVDFTVSASSHQKTQALLNEHCVSGARVETDFLLPSEMWGFAWVLSTYLGRLNEGILRSVRFEGEFRAKPGDLLYGSTTVLKHWKSLSGLPFVTTRTRVTTDDGMFVSCIEDDILLLNEVRTFPFYRERAIEQPMSINPRDHVERRRVYFRYEWDDGVWERNIHTDVFARHCGYERGLPEFICYLDWGLTAVLKQWPPRGVIRADFKKTLPLYHGDEFSIVVRRSKEGTVVRFVRSDHSVRLLAYVTSE